MLIYHRVSFRRSKTNPPSRCLPKATMLAPRSPGPQMLPLQWPQQPGADEITLMITGLMDGTGLKYVEIWHEIPTKVLADCLKYAEICWNPLNTASPACWLACWLRFGASERALPHPVSSVTWLGGKSPQFDAFPSCKPPFSSGISQMAMFPLLQSICILTSWETL